VAVPAEDEGFHEIQLNGKQLVFLFMAVTVVSVVIFLSGVLVGRGVRARQGEAPTDVTALAAEETTPRQAAPASTPAAGADPRAAQAPPAVDDLSYFNRLQQSTPAAETLKPQVPPATAAPLAHAAPPQPAAAARPSGAATAIARPTAPARTAGASAPARPAASPRPAGSSRDSGYAVQVAALNARPEAEAMARRLNAKGYTAYVMSPSAGLYRVRVGKFPTKREADTAAARLQREEHFKPWVTR
jgi:cell division septation protein DedD